MTLIEFSWFHVVIIGMVAMLVGMSKTGVHGAGTFVVPMLASVFGGQPSSGILLPMLCFADVLGVIYYHRHASWEHLRKLFPWAMLGIALGTIAGNYIPDEGFRIIMAVTIIISVVVMLWLERGHNEDVPAFAWFAALMGIVGGFTSMVGNLAGSVMAVYFLAMRLPKNEYIGTAAWFFLVINWLKIPFHVFFWHTITWESIVLDLLTIPAIALGAVVGVFIVKHIPKKLYRWFIVTMTLAAAIYILIK